MMNEVVERFRSAMQQAEEQDYQDGVEAGRRWAGGDPAPYREVKRLGRLRDKLGNDWDGWFEQGDSAWSVAERLYFALYLDDDGDRNAAAGFWGEDGREQEGDFYRGWAD